MNMDTRAKHLLAKTSQDLDQGIAPLGEKFLVDNDVTLDEAYNLCDCIKHAIDTQLTFVKWAES